MEAKSPSLESVDNAAPRNLENERDLLLMELIATGDHVAFRELVERHQHSVVGTVTRMLGNFSEAEDISQQVFMRIWRHARRYRPEAKFTTYLFTITRNLVFNETRRRKRRKEVSCNEREAVFHTELAANPKHQPDNELLKNEMMSAVNGAIDGLPEIQRMAVILRRQENMAYEEIAVILHVSVPAVKSLLFRARKTLRDSLENYLG